MDLEDELEQKVKKYEALTQKAINLIKTKKGLTEDQTKIAKAVADAITSFRSATK